MAETFACSPSLLPRLMGASSIVYLIGDDESVAERIDAVVDALEIETGHLLVSVLDASALATLGPGSRQALGGDGDAGLLFRVDAEPGLGFDGVSAAGIDLVTVPAPPTAASVVYFDGSGTEHCVEQGLDRLGSLCRWLAAAESRSGASRPVVVAGADADKTVAAALVNEHRASALDRVHQDLLAAHREQAVLLSDLRLEHGELLIRTMQLGREVDALRARAASTARELDALRESDTSARSELDAVHATRLFRYTAGLRRAYAWVRERGRK